MHTAPMSDSQGEFAEFKTQPDVPCRKCGVHAVSMRSGKARAAAGRTTSTSATTAAIRGGWKELTHEVLVAR